MKELIKIGKLYGLLMGGTAVFITVFSLFLAIVQPAWSRTPTSMMGQAASISSRFFWDMVSLEVPHMKSSKEPHTFTFGNVTSFLSKLVLNINPFDPITFVGAAIPGLNENGMILLYKGNSDPHEDYPIDHPQPDDLPDTEAQTNNGEAAGTPVPEATPGQGPEASRQPETTPQPQKNELPKRVLIYHSHNRESWIPDLPEGTEANAAFHPTKNVTELGTRLGRNLEEKGIGVIHSLEDYNAMYGENYKGSKSYQYSKKVVKEAMAIEPGLSYLIDIHRDSGPRKSTTKTINGKDYAQLYFVVGLENPNWEKNQEFAKKIHTKLNDKYPGISKGIYGKDRKQGNGIYNQEISANSCLIEIGGVENNEEERNRTVDVLSEVFQELITEENKG